MSGTSQKKKPFFSCCSAEQQKAEKVIQIREKKQLIEINPQPQPKINTSVNVQPMIYISKSYLIVQVIYICSIIILNYGLMLIWGWPFCWEIQGLDLNNYMQGFDNPHLEVEQEIRREGNEESSGEYLYLNGLDDYRCDDVYGYEDFSQPSPTFRNYSQQDQINDVRSETVGWRVIEAPKISNIYEKYLNSEREDHGRRSSRSERKSLTNKPFTAKFKKKKQTPQQVQGKFDPLTQGFEMLQMDSSSLLTQIERKVLQGDNQKGILLTQLGMKNLKTIGKNKFQRQMKFLKTFLLQKTMPRQYIDEFMLLISS